MDGLKIFTTLGKERQAATNVKMKEGHAFLQMSYPLCPTRKNFDLKMVVWYEMAAQKGVALFNFKTPGVFFLHSLLPHSP